jgi:hypothetical protein
LLVDSNGVYFRNIRLKQLNNQSCALLLDIEETAWLRKIVVNDDWAERGRGCVIVDAQPFCLNPCFDPKWSLSPYINRFLQPDTVIPDLSDPQSWNRYSYVLNRPIRFSGPTGHWGDSDSPCGVLGDQCTGTVTLTNGGSGSGGSEDHDANDAQTGGQLQADVTEWLVGEMDIELWWLGDFANCGNNPFCLYRSHLDLFGDYGKYDIKRSMQKYIGDAVVLCAGAGCRWVDYSAPGNIMYGYLSASRAVPQPISWVAAGLLEYKNSVKYKEPYTGTPGSWGDNPGDKAAVDFGYQLYEQYPNGITLGDFQTSLSEAILNAFQSPAIVPNQPAYPAPSNGYPVDYFLWPIQE